MTPWLLLKKTKSIRKLEWSVVIAVPLKRNWQIDVFQILTNEINEIIHQELEVEQLKIRMIQLSKLQTRLRISRTSGGS